LLREVLHAPPLSLIRSGFASIDVGARAHRDEVLTKSFENVAGQFDQYLANIYYTRRDPQRGLVIFDKAAYEEKLQGLSAVFKNHGHSLGKFRNFSEVPLFLDSKASRLIQMADLIAYWIFRYFQSGDDRGYRLIAPHFHANKGVQHGFIKMVTPACEQRLVSLPFSHTHFRLQHLSSPQLLRRWTQAGQLSRSAFRPQV
jgi:hypothetical protein